MGKWEGEGFRALPFLEKKLPGWMWRLNTRLENEWSRGCLGGTQSGPRCWGGKRAVGASCRHHSPALGSAQLGAVAAVRTSFLGADEQVERGVTVTSFPLRCRQVCCFATEHEM